jgi:hypothetical protein
MSTEAAVPALADQRRVGQATLRFAFGVTGCFVAAELLDADFAFLAPMFAAQLLAAPGPPPSAKAGLMIVGVIALALGFCMTLTTVFITSSWSLILAFLLVLYVAFYAQRRGVSNIVAMALQIGAIMVPSLSVPSAELATTFVVSMIAAVAIAIFTVWIVHGIFPDPGEAGNPAGPPAPPPVARAEAAAFALRNTLIMAPIVGWYLLDASQVALVLPITLLMVIRQHDTTAGMRVVVAMIVGNVIAGVFASVVHGVIQLQPNIVFFALLFLLSGLMFATGIFRGGPLAPLLSLAFPTFVLLLGIGLAPPPGGSDEAFVSRLFNVLLATGYGAGALSLWGRRATRRASP